MKTKNIVLAAGLVGLTAAALGTKTYLDYQEDRRISQIVAEVRDFFSKMGDIATVYVDQTQSDKVQVKGGVIMVDETVYYFDYMAGEIFYKKELL